MTKRIIQPDSYSCYACVAAMITGETLKDVIEFCGHDGSGYDQESAHPEKRSGFYDREIFKYLADKGYHVGTWSHFQNYASLDGIDHIQIDLRISDCHAMIVVKSKRFDECHHVLYWNGEMIFDPSPDAPNDPDIADYEVYNFMPIFKW